MVAGVDRGRVTLSGYSLKANIAPPSSDEGGQFLATSRGLGARSRRAEDGEVAGCRQSRFRSARQIAAVVNQLDGASASFDPERVEGMLFKVNATLRWA